MPLRNLDMLRACLALMVLFGHARGMLWMPWHEWKLMSHASYEWVLAYATSGFRFGAEAVMVFFALSGFFIHLRMAMQASRSAHAAPFSASDYLRRRARRILPPYYAALLLVLVLDGVGTPFFPEVYTAHTGDALLDANFQHSSFSAASTVPAMLAQPTLLSYHFGSNHPLWSIKFEVVFYALYPAFIALWLRSRWLAYGIATSLSLACWFYPLLGPWSSVLAQYPLWLAGALMAELLCHRPKLSQQRSWVWLMRLTALGSLAVVGSPLAQGNALVALPLGMLLGMSCIGAFVALPEAWAKSRPAHVLEWLGIRSYSIYIFHFPVIVLISSAVIHLTGHRPASGWLALAGAGLALGVGLLGYRLVESRFLPNRSLPASGN